jgi:8-oxo-dGTP pyrophosphatase MutT (NUDIX family)
MRQSEHVVPSLPALSGDRLSALHLGIADILGKPLPGMEAWRTMMPPFRHRLNSDAGDAPGTLREAAVLVALHGAEGRIAFPLLVRSHELRHHAGQIGLPGGSVEPGESPVEAALREMYEETGIAVDKSQVAGALSDIVAVPSGYLVHPFVAVCEGRSEYRLDRNESLDIFDASLAELLDPANRSHFSRHWEGHDWKVPCFRLGGRIVWGLTAMILAELAQALLGGTMIDMQKICKNTA